MKHWVGSTFRQGAWAPLTVFIVYALIAKGFGVGMVFPWLDIPAHLFGGMAIAYFFAIGIANIQVILGTVPQVIQMALSLGLTAITAVAWEFLEFAADIALGTHINLGVADTLSDLFFGLLGGVIVVSFKVVTARNKEISSR
jgi:hypothetical protein